MSLSSLDLVRSVVCLGCIALAGCGGEDASAGSSANPHGTNRARFVFDVDLQGVKGVLVMEVEVVASTGVVWGPGVQPNITGVIGTGDYTIYTAGELRSPVAHYVFRGENNFADFTEPSTFERFRVQWIQTPRGLQMIVNPFGPGPAYYDCVLARAEAL